MLNSYLHEGFTEHRKAQFFIEPLGLSLGTKIDTCQLQVPGVPDEGAHQPGAQAFAPMGFEYRQAADMAVGQHAAGSHIFTAGGDKNMVGLRILTVEIRPGVDALLTGKDRLADGLDPSCIRLPEGYDYNVRHGVRNWCRYSPRNESAEAPRPPEATA